MKGALPETIFIYEKLLYNEQKRQIQDFLDDVQMKKEKYETEVLWLIDQKIGGIGGYCMPADPKLNPFPGGINRELFRPLQYVRSEIDICDIRMHARHVVHYSGMHLEAVLRLFLKNVKLMGKLRFFNSTLGKAAHEISKMNIFDGVIIESLLKFVSLYNKAKHEVNMIEERPRMFSPEDAIICYFSARLIGQVVLTELRYPLSLSTYDINTEAFGF
ncbi:hypothetical protein [Tepidibacter sp. Z1-5]|uniref:hypothetical protein n=1 Tax=Tepidibacter sp. Z1-5 TaxID=3134138 RepID=UPI0030C0A161